MKAIRKHERQLNTTVHFEDDRVVIGPVLARWPHLDQKNSRSDNSSDGKYELAIVLEAEEAQPILEHMKELHDSYLARNQKSAEMECKPIGEKLENGRIKLELQNRQVRPDVFDVDGNKITENIQDRSLVNVVAQPTTYTTNFDGKPFTGVSLRLLAVHVAELPATNQDLLVQFAGMDVANSDDTDTTIDSDKNKSLESDDEWDVWD